MNYYNENDPLCCAWLRILIAAHRLPPGDVDDRSIEDVKPQDLKGYTHRHFFAGIGVWPYAFMQAGWPETISTFTGSCPCQPFSAPGQHKGIADRRHLWPAWYRLIRECRPDALFGEQVTTKNGLSWFDAVSLDLERQGYAVGACGTTPAGFGAPHRRQRLYFAGRLGDANRWRQMELSPRARREARNTGSRNERLADTSIQRLERTELQQRKVDLKEQPINGSVGCSVRGNTKATTKRRHTKSFWSDCEWLPSKDGTKERPIEPGSFSLAYGAPEGVGLVRGFGNALCAQQAIGFIEAFMECST